jgi:hypothetical protein
MIKNSTLFFIYDNLNKENELYTSQDLIEEGGIDEEIEFLLDKIDFSPSQTVLKRILEKAM